MEASKKLGLKQFEIENDIISEDKIFEFNEEEYQKLLKSRPWEKDPRYFKKVKISAIALIKMVTHTKAGGNIEVMGLMQGKIYGDTIFIMDSYPLPVEASETRVNAQNDAYEFLTKYNDYSEEGGRVENICGWYHSHPSYACWLSGIDVATQSLQQKQGPMVAIVIDPIRTASTGRVEIGAFRTFPENYRPSSSTSEEKEAIPLHKIQEWGLHADKYYALQVSYYKSKLDSEIIDALWNKYWITTLSRNSIIQNSDYYCDTLCDIVKKLPNCISKVSKYDKVISTDELIGKQKSEFKEYIKYSMERSQTLIQESIKGMLFDGANR